MAEGLAATGGWGRDHLLAAQDVLDDHLLVVQYAVGSDHRVDARLQGEAARVDLLHGIAIQGALHRAPAMRLVVAVGGVVPAEHGRGEPAIAGGLPLVVREEGAVVAVLAVLSHGCGRAAGVRWPWWSAIAPGPTTISRKPSGGDSERGRPGQRVETREETDETRGRETRRNAWGDTGETPRARRAGSRGRPRHATPGSWAARPVRRPDG